MSAPKISDIIRFSWQKTKEILFPFEFKRWLKILFIVWLAGQMGGGGSNFNLPNRMKQAAQQTAPQSAPYQDTQSSKTASQMASQTAQTTKDAASLTPTPANSDLQTAPVPKAPDQEAAQFKEPQSSQTAARRAFEKLRPWLIVIIPLVIALGLLFGWLGSRFNFIFLEVMVHRDVKIKETFGRYKLQGNSYFLWGLAFAGIAFCGLGLLILIGALLKSAALLVVVIPLVLIGIVALVVIALVVVDFVSPIMYRDGLKTMEAIKRFSSFKPSRGAIFIYFLVKIGLGIAAAIIALLVSLVVVLLTGLAALMIVLVGAGLVAAASFLKPILLVIGVLLLIPTIVALMIVLGMVLLPIPIFFRAFSLAFLARLIPEYNLLSSPSE